MLWAYLGYSPRNKLFQGKSRKTFLTPRRVTRFAPKGRKVDPLSMLSTISLL